MFDKKKVPNFREQSEKITSGETKEKHLGKKTSNVLAQELYSLMNTKEAFRDSNWKTKFNAVRDLMKEMGIWEGFVVKLKLQHERGLTI